MKLYNWIIGGCVVCSLLISPALVMGAGKPHEKPKASLGIARDPATGNVLLNWTGKGILKQSTTLDGRYKPMHKGKPGDNTVVLEPALGQEVFRVEAPDDGVVSVNVVGYVNLQLAPGLSLIANPLYYTNNDLAFWLPTAPDGAQVYKYTDGGGYEVSTFSAAAGAWSNPDLQVPIGTGFYFNNPSSETFMYTFVGEVMQGTLMNPLPAGISTKGALVPQAGSINSIHNLPGQAGDEIRLYRNTPEGGVYLVSFFDVDQNGWVPDVILEVGQGFWIKKENPQVWVRIFTVN